MAKNQAIDEALYLLEVAQRGLKQTNNHEAAGIVIEAWAKLTTLDERIAEELAESRARVEKARQDLKQSVERAKGNCA